MTTKDRIEIGMARMMAKTQDRTICPPMREIAACGMMIFALLGFVTF